jgi:glycosyltransferase involved in cell wall biosynthesis
MAWAAEAPAEGGAPTLIFLVTEDWYFWAHRLPQARAAREAGFNVAVATRVDAHGDRIRAEGFTLYPLGWRRGSTNPLAGLAAVREIARLYRRVRPAVVHHVSQKSILVGSIAARIAAVPNVVNAFTGLGFLFTVDTPKTRTIRGIIGHILRRIAARPGVRFLVENPEDGVTLARLKIVPKEKITLIRGSGVDLSRYSVLPEPPEPVVFGCAARMLRIKGVEEVVAAFRLLRQRGSPARLLLAGAPDSQNPAAISKAELEAWSSEPGISWIGHVDDVRDVWSRAHVAVLASRGGEGIPMTLMEAAACGRPLVATDVPGCREIVVPGETGLLAAAGDVSALADMFERIADDGDLRRRCGEAARRRIVEGLDAATVGRETVAVYRALLRRSADAGAAR